MAIISRSPVSVLVKPKRLVCVHTAIELSVACVAGLVHLVVCSSFSTKGSAVDHVMVHRPSRGVFSLRHVSVWVLFKLSWSST